VKWPIFIWSSWTKKKLIKCPFHLTTGDKGYSIRIYTWKTITPYMFAINTSGLANNPMLFLPFTLLKCTIDYNLSLRLEKLCVHQCLHAKARLTLEYMHLSHSIRIINYSEKTFILERVFCTTISLDNALHQTLLHPFFPKHTNKTPLRTLKI